MTVLAHTGFNQEDSVIIKKSSIQRGMSYVYSENEISTHEKAGEEIAILPNDLRKTGLDYSILNERGIIKVGTVVTKNTLVVGKVKSSHDSSVIIKLNSECGVVSRVVDTTTQGKVRIVNVMIRRYRETEIRDKYSSNASQKGICGLILNQVDMPFSRDLVPDVIINPLAFTNRMTLSQLISTAAGIIACYTAFIQKDNVIDDLAKRLNSLCLNGGKGVMYCGLTGKKLETSPYFRLN